MIVGQRNMRQHGIVHTTDPEHTVAGIREPKVANCAKTDCTRRRVLVCSEGGQVA